MRCGYGIKRDIEMTKKENIELLKKENIELKKELQEKIKNFLKNATIDLIQECNIYHNFEYELCFNKNGLKLKFEFKEYPKEKDFENVVFIRINGDIYFSIKEKEKDFNFLVDEIKTMCFSYKNDELKSKIKVLAAA